MSRIVEIIAREIKERGAVSFARFMELALYCPDCGYYEKEEDTIGKRGDFFTSVSVGSLFGELLAFQFSEWLEERGTRNAERGTEDSSLKIVEAGAHTGKLAKDTLSWLRERRPQLFGQIEYCIIEPSPRRQTWQKNVLREFAGRIRWFVHVSELEYDSPGVNGIVFSNELLDAMPVHRIGWDAKSKKWFEWGVALDGDGFAWTRMSSEKFRVSGFGFRVSGLPEKLLEVLPDGFTTEISRAAERWCREAAAVLRHGTLLTIDYGLAAEEFFAPERSEGTLRAYHRHQLVKDLLARAGEQDLTAHVDFTALQAAGEAAGLTTEALVSQEKFLAGIVGRISKDPAGFGDWTPARARQFQTLAHPEHLGRPFRVLIQKRD